MNDHGALTVRAAETHATYHVVEFADSRLRERLARFDAGNTIQLSLTRTGTRANVWRADGVYPGVSELASASVY
jgi:hypothetical protein